MRSVFLLLFVFLGLRSTALDLEKVRMMYFEAGKNPKKSELLIQLLPEEKAAKSPLLKAYRGAAITMSAENTSNPFEKLNVFSKGKTLLEEAIKSDPANTEIRFLRFSVQSECPSFLNYSMNISEDKNHILQNWKTFSQPLSGTSFLNEVKSYLKSSKKLSADEKARLV